MTNTEKICPIISSPHDKGTNELNLRFNLVPCQNEKCKKYVSCMVEEYEALVRIGFNEEAWVIKEKIKEKIKSIQIGKSNDN